MAGTIIVDKIQLDVGQDTLRVFSNTGSTILSANTSGINAASLGYGTLPSGRLPTGAVLQVVQATSTTSTATTSASFVDSGLTASITPTSATSKIFVLVSQQIRGSGRADPGFGIRLVRDSTTVFTRDDSGTSSYVNASDFRLAHSIVYLDSPATTSSTTYKTQINSYASGTITAQNTNLPSTITLMEIAA